MQYQISESGVMIGSVVNYFGKNNKTKTYNYSFNRCLVISITFTQFNSHHSTMISLGIFLQLHLKNMYRTNKQTKVEAV